jgi:hypothetical protein
MGVNFIIHLFALFSTAYFIFYYARLNEENKFILKLLRLQKNSKLYVIDNPSRIVKKIAQYFAVAVECDNTNKIKKIRLDRFFRCFIFFVVTKLSYEINLSGKHCLVIMLLNFEQVDALSLQNDLSDDLGISVVIKEGS